MTRLVSPRLNDRVEACAHLRAVLEGVTLDAFEQDWRKKWLVERGVEIISEASRHLPDELKAAHPEIPWRKVAGIGNEYERIAPDILFKLVGDELPPLEAICRQELALALAREQSE